MRESMGAEMACRLWKIPEEERASSGLADEALFLFILHCLT